MTISPTSKLSPFAEDVVAGLSSDRRHLSSKWFYDDRGTALFQQIMESPEYYLTEAEAGIYRSCTSDLLHAIAGRPFDLIEFGAGDGTKTQLLIERFLAAGAQFSYRPIDLSDSALRPSASSSSCGGPNWNSVRSRPTTSRPWTDWAPPPVAASGWFSFQEPTSAILLRPKP